MSRPGSAPQDVQAAFCAVLCDEWARAGVTDAIVCPGSRSTPLVAALDAEPRIRVTVVLDERSGGFTALGCGLATGRPAVVVTTSGTASVELHPAIVEAGQGYVPLIAVTTDRPPELHHVGAPQTVEQTGLFGPVVRWAVDPGVPELTSAGMWRSISARSVAEAVASPSGPGPVHVNLPFREPLLGDGAAVDVPPGREGGGLWHAVASNPPAVPPADAVELLRRHARGRGLIVAGHGADHGGPGHGADAVVQLAEMLGWPLLADPRSGCRVPSGSVVSTADALLRTPEVSGWTPDLVLRIGAPWASKVLNQWLAGLPAGVPQVLVDPWGRWADPERKASLLVRSTARALSDAIRSCSGGGPDGGSGSGSGRTDWASGWAEVEKVARRAIDGLLGSGSELEMSEPAVAGAVLEAVPAGGSVVVSSSMPVRDVEWYGPPVVGRRVLSNRGANGIDGVVSTAVGAALGRGAEAGPTLALLGDLAFVYDAGALLWSSQRPLDLRLVVVDNDGGGIFSFLPQASALPPDRFERYWGTPHGLDLVAVAAAYGARAERVTTRQELGRFLSGPGDTGAKVAVVPSERRANVTAHDRLNAAVAEAVAEAFR